MTKTDTKPVKDDNNAGGAQNPNAPNVAATNAPNPDTSDTAKGNPQHSTAKADARYDFSVFNNGTGGRGVIHGGRMTEVAPGQTVTIKNMTQAEADNAAHPGMTFKRVAPEAPKA